MVLGLGLLVVRGMTVSYRLLAVSQSRDQGIARTGSIGKWKAEPNCALETQFGNPSTEKIYAIRWRIGYN